MHIYIYIYIYLYITIYVYVFIYIYDFYINYIIDLLMIDPARTFDYLWSLT